MAENIFTEKELEALRVSGIQVQIDELKQQLEKTDYRVIKNMECIALEKALPYDAEQLHAERQELRDKINELEGEI